MSYLHGLIKGQLKVFALLKGSSVPIDYFMTLPYLSIPGRSKISHNERIMSYLHGVRKG